MKSRFHRLIADSTELYEQNKVLKWLYANRHDPELSLILISADEHDCLDDLIRFMAWALNRALLHPRGAPDPSFDSDQPF